LSNVSTTKSSLLLAKLLTQIVLPIYVLFSLFKIFEVTFISLTIVTDFIYFIFSNYVLIQPFGCHITINMYVCIMYVNTRSASIVSLVHPTNPSHLKITNGSFFHMVSVLWNRLPNDLHARSQCLAENSSASPSPFALSPSQFHAKLKSYLFHKLFAPITSFSSAGRIFMILDMASDFFSSHLSFSFTHLIIFTHCLHLDFVNSV
jgi:hypothetical protein